MFGALKALGKVGKFLFKHKKTNKVSTSKTLATSITALIVVLLVSAGLSPEIAQALADVLVSIGQVAVE